jgi:hypothetical protein
MYQAPPPLAPLEVAAGNLGLFANDWYACLPGAYFRNSAKLKLTPREHLVLQYVIWKAGTSNSAFPAESTIAEHLGVNVRTVERAISTFKKRKILGVRRRYNDSNVYDVQPLWDLLAVLDKNTDPEVKVAAKQARAKTFKNSKRKVRQVRTDAAPVPLLVPSLPPAGTVASILAEYPHAKKEWVEKQLYDLKLTPSFVREILKTQKVSEAGADM